VRRRAQLLALRRDLEVADLRGNVDTRLRKLAEGGYDAIVLAAAGLERLGRAGEGNPVPADQMLPAPGQGCLALEVRSGDDEARKAVAAISDPAASACLAAERDCVIALGATCDTPVGAYAEPTAGGVLLRAWAGAADGSAWVSDKLEGSGGVGRELAERMLSAGG
jgi:hydroxymethylbilane synthase